MSHTIAARRLADTVATADRTAAVEAGRRGVYEGVERVGRLVQRQQAAKVNIQNCRRLTGQYWRYGESVAAVLSSCPQTSLATANASANATSTTSQPALKYANLQLPPYDLQLFERIVDRLDGLLDESTQAASNLRDELEHRSQKADNSDDVAELARAAVNAQVAVREAAQRVGGFVVEAEEDRKSYRRFLVKYKNDSTDPFPVRRRQL